MFVSVGSGSWCKIGITFFLQFFICLKTSIVLVILFSRDLSNTSIAIENKKILKRGKLKLFLQFFITFGWSLQTKTFV